MARGLLGSVVCWWAQALCDGGSSLTLVLYLRELLRLAGRRRRVVRAQGRGVSTREPVWIREGCAGEGDA